jgi:transposase
MPGRPIQSKLEPHLDFIRECRRKRWSYCRIAQAIHEQFGMKVSPNTVFSFVKVRSKPLRMYELHSTKAQPIENQPSTSGFFEPAPEQKTHETRKPKWNVSLKD